MFTKQKLDLSDGDHIFNKDRMIMACLKGECEECERENNSATQTRRGKSSAMFEGVATASPVTDSIAAAIDNHLAGGSEDIENVEPKRCSIPG